MPQALISQWLLRGSMAPVAVDCEAPPVTPHDKVITGFKSPPLTGSTGMPETPLSVSSGSFSPVVVAGVLRAAPPLEPGGLQPPSIPATQPRGDSQGAGEEAFQNSYMPTDTLFLESIPDAQPENTQNITDMAGDPDGQARLLTERLSNCGMKDLEGQISAIFKDMHAEQDKLFEAKTTGDRGSLNGWEQEVWLACEKGDFDIRGKLGQKFQKEHRKGTEAGEEYKFAGNSHVAKAAFRLAWTQKKKQIITERLKQSEKQSKIDYTNAQYEPFAIIVRNEGGFDDPTGNAVRAASSYASKCVILGPPWVAYNSMTERVDFLYMKKGIREEFEQSWSRHRSSMKGPKTDEDKHKRIDSTQAEVQEKLTPGSGKKSTTEEEDPKDTKKGKRKLGEETTIPQQKKDNKKPKKSEAGEETPQKKKDILGEATGAARRAKAYFSEVVGRANSLMQTVRSQSEWAWANNEPMLQPIMQQSDKVQAILVKDTFLRRLISAIDSKEVLRGMRSAKNTEEEIVVEFKKAVEKINACVGPLDQSCRILCAMHASRDSASSKAN